MIKQKLIHWLGLPLRKTVKWYLSKPRSFRHGTISVTVPPGVFHPGFFFSTRLLLEFLETQTLEGKTFLELGSGSGVISIFAAKKGAHVTACDINTKAVMATLENSRTNHTKIDVIQSDLFTKLNRRFDWMVINPPYYNATPEKEEDYAWYCGKEFQYFERFFHDLPDHTHDQSRVLMILSEVCDLGRIFSIAEKSGYVFDKILERNIWADGKNYLYWIRRSDRLPQADI